MFNTIFPKIHKKATNFWQFQFYHFCYPIFSKFLGSISILLTVWVYYFFRDPERYSINNDDFLVSPADGLITDISEDRDLKNFAREYYFQKVFL